MKKFIVKLTSKVIEKFYYYFWVENITISFFYYDITANKLITFNPNYENSLLDKKLKLPLFLTIIYVKFLLFYYSDKIVRKYRKPLLQDLIIYREKNCALISVNYHPIKVLFYYSFLNYAKINYYY